MIKKFVFFIGAVLGFLFFIIEKIRLCIAVVLYTLFVVIAPNIKDDKEEVQDKEEDTPLAFKDLPTYLKELQSTQDNDRAAMEICRGIKRVSVVKKSAVKLTYTSSTHYTGGIRDESTIRTNISGYNNERWYKLRPIEMSPTGMVAVVREMIEALAQEGWGCIDNAADQLFDFIDNTFESNDKYLLNRSRVTGINGRMQLQTNIIVDLSGNSKKSSPPPQISIRITIWSDEKDTPVEAVHYIYFSQKMAKLEKSAE